MFRTRSVSFFLLAFGYLSAGPAPQATADFLSYSVKNLGVPPGESGSQGYGLNDLGQVAGYVNSHAGFYDGVAFHDLGGFRADANSIAFGINNAGMIVGSGVTSDNSQHAFLYTGKSGFKDLGTLGGPTSAAGGINDKGQIVGTAYNATPLFRAFLYQNGVMKDLGTLGGQASFAGAINGSGEVTGSSENAAGVVHAFLYVNNKIIDLGIPAVPAHATALRSDGRALNDKGVVVGTYQYFDANNNNNVRAFMYDGVRFTDLGTLGGNDVRANGINNAGDVVGASLLSNNFDEHAFLFHHGHMYDLNDLIRTGTGFTLEQAAAINKAGQILVNGTDDKGNARAFLLTPDSKNTPEPSSLILVILGGFGMLGIVRKMRSS
jgi:probable HAF family extracellular repeat protein